jgi:Asp-tRNA(Asn)/Glu-tRNA(Gln) amidotransferase A subunit family amidase
MDKSQRLRAQWEPLTKGLPSSQDQAHFAELLEISKRIQSRQISSVEATQAQLKRIEQLDGSLKSYATVMAEHRIGRRTSG